MTNTTESIFKDFEGEVFEGITISSGDKTSGYGIRSKDGVIAVDHSLSQLGTYIANCMRSGFTSDSGVRLDRYDNQNVVKVDVYRGGKSCNRLYLTRPMELEDFGNLTMIVAKELKLKAEFLEAKK